MATASRRCLRRSCMATYSSVADKVLRRRSTRPPVGGRSTQGATRRAEHLTGARSAVSAVACTSSGPTTSCLQHGHECEPLEPVRPERKRHRRALSPSLPGAGVVPGERTIAEQRLDPRPLVGCRDPRSQVLPRLTARRPFTPRLREHGASTVDRKTRPPVQCRSASRSSSIPRTRSRSSASTAAVGPSSAGTVNRSSSTSAMGPSGRKKCSGRVARSGRPVRTPPRRRTRPHALRRRRERREPRARRAPGYADRDRRRPRDRRRGRTRARDRTAHFLAGNLVAHKGCRGLTGERRWR
jgi:hypothetical protein